MMNTTVVNNAITQIIELPQIRRLQQNNYTRIFKNPLV